MTGRNYFCWVLLLCASSVHASFSISPAGDTLQQCLPVELEWTEEPPIHLWAAPNQEDAPGDTTLHDFGVINSSSTVWTVNLGVGQNVSFTYVQTSNTRLLFSSPQAYTVVPGMNVSCLTGRISSASSSSQSSSSSVASNTGLSISVSSSSSSATPTQSTAVVNASHKSPVDSRVPEGVALLIALMLGGLTPY